MPCRQRCRTMGRHCILAMLAVALSALDAGAMPRRDEGVVRFFFPDSTAQEIFLAGDFNGWSPSATPLDREPGGFATRVFLDPGTYEYKFMVDGAWQRDPDNPEFTSRGASVLRVGPEGEVLPPRPTPSAEPVCSEARACPLYSCR